MNRYVFLCHVREEEASVTKNLAKAMAALGMKVVYRVVAPCPPNEEPRGVLREQVQTGLNECCYGVIFLSQAFIRRDWPYTELSEIVSRTARGEERLIHVLFGITTRDLAILYPPLLSLDFIVFNGDYHSTARSIYERLAEDDVNFRNALSPVHVNGTALGIFACRECESSEQFTLECLTAPPLGASGVLVCPSCGRGYAIRGDVIQLLSEGACNPDEPLPPNLQPLPEI